MLNHAAILTILQTVWSGAYTTDQAMRGQDAFVMSCAGCHGAPGDYRQITPAFQGNAFMERWRELNVGSIFNLIKDTMPRDNPGSLDEQTYLDIVSRFLQVNGFPAGMTPLTAGSAKTIQIEGKDGPKPPPNASIVHLVGCLAQDDKNNWIITKASEPVRSDRTQGFTPEE